MPAPARSRGDAASARRGRARRSALLTAVTAVMMLLGACTMGPSTRTGLAVRGGPAPVRGTASSAAAAPTLPLGPGGPGQVAALASWGDCPPAVAPRADDGTTFTVQCASVPVPVSYRQPARGGLLIHLARARSAATPVAAPPLVVMPADPGETSYADVATVAADLPSAVRDHFSVVTLDVRGTGASTGIDCTKGSLAAAIVALPADPTGAGAAQFAAASRQLTFDCGDMVGAALTLIDSTAAADDLDTIRAALGVDALTLVAAGGSATIGALYADRYPGRVAAMVLQSPADPTTDPANHALAAAEATGRLLDEFVASCPSFPGGCALGADPKRTIEALAFAAPGEGHHSGAWTITGGSVLFALTALLPDPSAWPSLASALAALHSGDASALAALVTGEGGDRPALSARLSSHFLFTCNDTAARLSPADIDKASAQARRQAPLFGLYAVGVASLCADWPAPDDAVGRLAGSGAAPVLVVGSVDNPVHPYLEAQSIARQLASASLVTWQSAGTDALASSACIRSAATDYLLHGVVPDPGLLCPP